METTTYGIFIEKHWYNPILYKSKIQKIKNEKVTITVTTYTPRIEYYKMRLRDLKMWIKTHRLKVTFRNIKYEFYLDGFEPTMYRVKVDGNTTERLTYGFFYPLGRRMLWIKQHYSWIKLYLSGYKPQWCDVCGESIAFWTISDPNYKSKSKRLKACNTCVHTEFNWRGLERKMKQVRRKI